MKNFEKDTLIDLICDALENGGHLIVAVKTDKQSAFIIQGNPISLTALMTQGFERERQLRAIMETAIKYMRDVKDPQTGEKPPDMVDEIMSHSPLDCESCPDEKDCPIKDERDKLLINAPDLDELFKAVALDGMSDQYKDMLKDMLITKKPRFEA